MITRTGSKGSMSEVGLKTKQKMPQLGFALSHAYGDEAANLVDLALEIGYRHIDTAFAYNNELAVGSVLKAWIVSGRITRDELFISAKLPPCGMRKEDVKRYLVQSLYNLGLEYVDLYSVHCPVGMLCDIDSGVVLDPKTDLALVWKGMEAAVDSGLTKSIGMCNFNTKQVQKILDCCRVRPAVLQIEAHVFLQQKVLVDLCRNRNILVSGLLPAPGSGLEFCDFDMNNAPTKDPFTQAVESDLGMQILSKKYGKTPTQLMIKWMMLKGLYVSVKLMTPMQMFTAYQVYDLEILPEDIKIMDGLERHERYLIPVAFFPGVEHHPEYPFKT